MPCSDQTEILEILLDFDDQILDFRLFKRTCGQPVGGMALWPYIQGRPLLSLLHTPLSAIVPDLEDLPLTDEFLLFKQFVSLQAALSVYLGREAGGPSEAFALEEIRADHGSLLLAGEISIAIVREKIRACGGCRSCRVPSSSHPRRAPHDSLFD